jgi:cytochrome c oxidase cbb3-type subunit III
MSALGFRRWIATCLAVSALACSRAGHEQQLRGASRAGAEIPAEGEMASIPLGDWAGVTPNSLVTTIKNPYAGDEAAIRAGRELFQNMNCADCHGYNLKGGMGPDLTDTYWRYGGSPAAIYKSIYEGRPEGMPAWGRTLTPALIWRLVAYIQSFGGGFPPQLATSGRQGDLGDMDTSGARTLRGRQNEEQ